MDSIYPVGPTAVPKGLAHPTKGYKRQAWLALAALLFFVVLYLALAGWFVNTAIRLFGAMGGPSPFLSFVMGLCSAFLAVFMLKALFFIKRGSDDNKLEILREEQPRLFAFLERLAGEAGAPRPHRIFLTPGVNAAVFYDLSVLNLLFPSRKNLEIGLGLINVLTLAEFKAVCAHEFGHFAQRSMAVGRWVYISHQIIAHIVGKRDALDSFLQGLSRVDIRIAWVGWILSLIVWSIRSLLETAFRGVLLAQRALSREMELQADLVAVSLTGSDELVNALYRLGVADDAWSRTLDFISSQLAKKCFPLDAYAIQLNIIERMALLHGDERYGQPPSLPEENQAGHRVFTSEFAQPPTMWLTHPLNHDREANAKRVYIKAPSDPRTAWEIFDQPTQLKEQVTALLKGKAEAEPMPMESALEVLHDQFSREQLKPRYRGVYWGRSPVRWAATVAELQQEAAIDIATALETLYPASVTNDLTDLQTLVREKGMLLAIHRGALSAQGKQVRYREKEIPKNDIPRVVEELDREIAPIEQRLREHDRMCRSVHRAIALSVGNGWDDYLQGLLKVLHFAEHAEADLRDLQGCLSNVVAIESATRRVSQEGIDRIMEAAVRLHNAFVRLDDYANADNAEGSIHFDSALAARLSAEDWPSLAGKHGLPAPSRTALGEWLNVVDSWVSQWTGGLSALRQAALDELLTTEAKLAENFYGKLTLPQAPSPSQAPEQYAVLLPGNERKRQTRLGWWARFQTADGIPAMIGRLLVAGGIVGSVLGMGGMVGDAEISVYNGLGRPVTVTIGDKTISLAAFSAGNLSIKPQHGLRVEAHDEFGHLIEAFSEDRASDFRHYVYNVAAAGPLVQWTAVYGNATPQPEHLLGAKRWLETTADNVFQDPPKTIQTKGGGGTRSALSGFAQMSPVQVLEMVSADDEKKALLIQHARWDSPHSPYIMDWLESAANFPEIVQILDDRLSRDPVDIVALRTQQNLGGETEHQEACVRHKALAENSPDNASFHYLADRCIISSEARGNAYLADYKRWPNNPWLAFAAGYRLIETGRWNEGVAAMQLAFKQEPALANSVGLDIARVRRQMENRPDVKMADLLPLSKDLDRMQQLETGGVGVANEFTSYADLAKGSLDLAVQKVKGTAAEPRLLRLAAASEGAGAELIRKALDLPIEQGIDSSTFWASLALATREHRSVDVYLKMLGNDKNKEATQAMQKLVDRLQAADIQGANHVLGNLPFDLRGYANAMGVIILKERAPQAWRTTAKLALFAPERPYFK